MTDKQEVKICWVCGDRAIGTNFGAITCESCKAFFRRTALKNKQFICPFDENCKITSITRKFCQKCRLNKCFSVGMKKESILTDKEKQLMRIKIQENKRIKKFKKDIDLTITSDSMASNTTDSDNQPIARPIARPLTDYGNNFNELETNKLMELLSAIKLIRDPLITNWSSEMTTMEELRQKMSERFDRDIRRLVEAVKHLVCFRELCLDDQIALVKYGCVEVFNLRSIVFYNFESKEWTLPLDESNSFLLKLDLFKTGRRNIYGAFQAFLDSMRTEWDTDYVLIDLITAIMIFNPHTKGLVHRDVVLFQHKSYQYLLQRYLRLRYQSECESKSKFLRLMNILRAVYILGQIIRLNSSDRNDLKPFLKEILDVKSQTLTNN